MKWLRRKKKQEDQEPLIPVPIPSLVVVLQMMENQKGEPLTKDEVLQARDECPCITMPISKARAMAESRGYADIDPEYVWQQWQEVRQQMMEEG